MMYLIEEDTLLRLLNADLRLNDLEVAGVNNWEGYGEGGFSEDIEEIPANVAVSSEFLVRPS